MQTATTPPSVASAALRQIAMDHNLAYAELSIRGKQAFRVGGAIFRSAANPEDETNPIIEIVVAGFGPIVTRRVCALNDTNSDGVPVLPDMLRLADESYAPMGADVFRVLRGLDQLGQ